ncbi:MAG TPA: arylsulfatase [Candidatus Binatia bacterium]|nr:arylsulfatase [Candidatus Binatia bacterium]
MTDGVSRAMVSRVSAGFGGVIGRTYRESTPWWPPPARPPQGAPSVVVVVLDDVGFADLGCYGSDIVTPHMDALAAQGLRYTNFHVTSMCSPTRACLLSGRNAHAVGMGIIAEWSTGFPGYQGRLGRRAATLAEVLREHAYGTYAVGKWHLGPLAEATAAGPFDAWPLARGFDRWYGFHGALTDQWHPELFEDNHVVELPPRRDYHLSEDLVDRAIGYVRDHHTAAPDRPFFLYLAFGACHWPHHVPNEYLARYRGHYDRGWDEIRAERFARQQALGIVPPGTRLAPRNPDVPAWSALDADQRRLVTRLQEAYAAFLDHTDAQLGRLLAFLAAIERRADTLVVLLSDNGASPEGGPLGAVNERKHLNYEPETVAESLAALDRIGSEWAFNHYPTGWAQVSNTPLKWYKKDTHGGGIRAPLILSWPGRIPASGRRTQYHHVIDVMPTILELAGATAPSVYQGVPQLPMHGVSMAYTFEAPDAPTTRRVQHYELLGDRALWCDGWKAVARHVKGEDFDADRWELYHVDRDFSECDDLAAAHPQKLRELLDRWWAEAGAHDVLPLDDREYERVAANAEARARSRYVYYPGMARIDRLSAPYITDRSWRLTAEVEIPPAGAEGVLLAAGSRFAGYVLYLRDGRLVYEYGYSTAVRHAIRSATPVPAGSRVLGYEFRRTGPWRGRGTLSIDGRVVGEVDIPKTWPVHGTTAGVSCGHDAGAPVSDAYSAPFPFTGTLRRVVVELDGDGAGDPAGEVRGALGEE